MTPFKFDFDRLDLLVVAWVLLLAGALCDLQWALVGSGGILGVIIGQRIRGVVDRRLGGGQ